MKKYSDSFFNEYRDTHGKQHEMEDSWRVMDDMKDSIKELVADAETKKQIQFCNIYSQFIHILEIALGTPEE